MRKNRTVYMNLLFITLLIIACFSVSITSCAKSPGNNISETGAAITESTATDETESIEASISETVEETVEQESPEETQNTESPDTNNDKDVIVFRGREINGNKGLMILEINIVSGEITGLIQVGFRSFDMDMSTTQICDYVLEGSIAGNIDLETLEITGKINGKAVTETQSESCRDYNVNYTMTALMMEDKSRIKGYFDTKTQDKWEFFLKLDNE